MLNLDPLYERTMVYQTSSVTYLVVPLVLESRGPSPYLLESFLSVPSGWVL